MPATAAVVALCFFDRAWLAKAFLVPNSRPQGLHTKLTLSGTLGAPAAAPPLADTVLGAPAPPPDGPEASSVGAAAPRRRSKASWDMGPTPAIFRLRLYLAKAQSAPKTPDGEAQGEVEDAHTPPLPPPPPQTSPQ